MNSCAQCCFTITTMWVPYFPVNNLNINTIWRWNCKRSANWCSKEPTYIQKSITICNQRNAASELCWLWYECRHTHTHTHILPHSLSNNSSSILKNWFWVDSIFSALSLLSKCLANWLIFESDACNGGFQVMSWRLSNQNGLQNN